MSGTWLGRAGRRLWPSIVDVLTRRKWTYGPIAVALVLAGVLAGTAATADHDEDVAPLAARRITAARLRAADASRAVVDAQTHIARLSADIATAERRLADVRRRLAEPSPLRAAPPVGFAAGSSLAAVLDDDLLDVDPDDGSLEEDLAFAEREIDALTAVVAAARAEVVDLAAAAEEAFATLAAVEAHHLPDPAIEAELERMHAGGGTAGAAAMLVAARAATPHPLEGVDDEEPGEGGIVCPIDGETTFVDTWGAPRSGGRRHQGVDMMSSAGTPVVAVEAGSANFKRSRLGGRAIWLTGASGTTYYYAHLSDWEGESRDVERGAVIGYVGTTGNAHTPHLHFEVHPDDGRAVRPFGYVDPVC